MIHFSIKELCVSTKHPELVVIPTENSPEWLNLQALVESLLEPIRAKIQRPIYVSSGYRPPRLNAATGGAANSNHLTGCAADCHVRKGKATDTAGNLGIIAALLSLGIPFDECLLEGATFDKSGEITGCRWVHLAYRRGQPNRNKLRWTSDLKTYHPVTVQQETKYTFSK